MPSEITSSLSRMSQSDLFDYLQLGIAKKLTETKPCSVVIRGSKCSICKREFKCITDIHQHMLRKHKYLKRKSDDKLVRIKLKIGKETVCDNRISKKFLMTPKRGSKPIAAPNTSDSQLPQVGSTRCPLAVPLSAILSDLNKFEDGHYNDAACEIPSGSLNNLEPMFSEEQDQMIPSFSVDSCSDSENSVIYISDVELDLSKLYEDVKPIINAESDIEDAETVFLEKYLDNLNDFDLSPADLSGKICEDLSMADMCHKLGMTVNGFDNLVQFCETLDPAGIVDLDPIPSQVVEKGAEVSKVSIQTEIDAGESKIDKSATQSEIRHSDKEKDASRKKRLKKTNDTRELQETISKLEKQVNDILGKINGRKHTKRTDRNSKVGRNLRSGFTRERILRRSPRFAEVTRRGSESTRSESSDAESTRTESLESFSDEVVANSNLDQTETRLFVMETMPETVPDNLEILDTGNMETNQNLNNLEAMDDLESTDLKERIGYRSLEDIEEVRQRLQESDNNYFIDLTEEDSIGLESSEVTFSLAVPLEGKTNEEEDIIIVDDDDKQSLPQLEDFIADAISKYYEECKVSSRAHCDTNNNHKKYGATNSEFQYQLKKALRNLGVNIEPPSLKKDEEN